MMKNQPPKKTEAAAHISKQELLDLLSKRLGCKPDEVGFLFQSNDMLSSLEDLTIPDRRSTF